MQLYRDKTYPKQLIHLETFKTIRINIGVCQYMLFFNNLSGLNPDRTKQYYCSQNK